jgi:hypothetical protein
MAGVAAIDRPIGYAAKDLILLGFHELVRFAKMLDGDLTKILILIQCGTMAVRCGALFSSGGFPGINVVGREYSGMRYMLRNCGADAFACRIKYYCPYIQKREAG